MRKGLRGGLNSKHCPRRTQGMGNVSIVMTLLGLLVFSSSAIILSFKDYSNGSGPVPSVVGDASWAFQNQNQQNTGYSPQTLISASNIVSLTLKWSTKIGGLTGTPVISNGIVYVTSLLPASQTKSSIYAVNESTGKIIWIDGPTHATKLTFSTSVGVTIDSGSVFAATYNNQLVRLNALTGAVQWTSNILKGTTGSANLVYKGPEATPLVFKGFVIVGETFGDGNPGVRG
ncbi:MAG: PQQ-binding-like beta-propeller repeat protein, partial [Nitrososphaerales archaeon]